MMGWGNALIDWLNATNATCPLPFPFLPPATESRIRMADDSDEEGEAPEGQINSQLGTRKGSGSHRCMEDTVAFLNAAALLFGADIFQDAIAGAGGSAGLSPGLCHPGWTDPLDCVCVCMCALGADSRVTTPSRPQKIKPPPGSHLRIATLPESKPGSVAVPNPLHRHQAPHVSACAGLGSEASHARACVHRQQSGRHYNPTFAVQAKGHRHTVRREMGGMVRSAKLGSRGRGQGWLRSDPGDRDLRKELPSSLSKGTTAANSKAPGDGKQNAVQSSAPRYAMGPYRGSRFRLIAQPGPPFPPRQT
jgi:hypothetical protein